MGWFLADRPGHEGYIVAYVLENGSSDLWREVHYPEKHEGEVKRLAVGCTCGWRSPLCVAPYGTRWAPYSIWLPERDEGRYEDKACRVWRQHMRLTCGYPVDPASIFDLAAHALPVPVGRCSECEVPSDDLKPIATGSDLFCTDCRLRLNPEHR